MKPYTIFLISVFFVAGSFLAHSLTIKLGSIAPANSPWDNVLRGLSADWERITEGNVKLRVFSGGIVGDDESMIRKMRIGQLDAAAMPGGGIARIYSGIMALSSPMLFRNNNEFRFVLNEMIPHLEAELENKGFIGLSWSPIGWAHFFSREPFITNSDLQKQKLWIFDAEPIEVRAWLSAGFDVVPLPTTEVMTALQSGMIDAYVTSPMSAASFQWFGITPHMNDMLFAPIIGGIVITKRTWNRIPARYRKELKETARKASQQLSEQSQKADQQAIDAMSLYGLKVHSATVELEQEWNTLVEERFSELIGTIIDQKAYDLVIAKIAEYRTTNND